MYQKDIFMDWKSLRMINNDSKSSLTDNLRFAMHIHRMTVMQAYHLILSIHVK